MNAKTLLLKAKRQVFGELSGNNLSKSIGDGYDFFELKPYVYGEDVRRIDWKRSAKMSEPYTKSFHQEKQINLAIVPILSGSLFFGMKRLKQEVLAEVAAICAYSALKNQDSFCFCNWVNQKADFDTFSKNRIQINNNIEKITNTNLLGYKDGFDGLENLLFKKLKYRSLVVFIGDFWRIPNFASLAKKHEVICFIVRDKFEEKPFEVGNLKIINPISLSQNNVIFDAKNSIRHSKNVKAYDEKLTQSLAKQSIRFTKIYTDDEVFVKLKKFFR